MKLLFTALSLLLGVNHSFAQNCINFSDYDQAYLDSVNSLPPGSILFAAGPMALNRPDQMSQYQFLQGDTLMYVGNLDINVTQSNCSSKYLTFDCVYLEGLAVDGDTIFSSLNPPLTYNGSGWNFEHVDMGSYVHYVITGDFNLVQLFTQTNFIWNICLDDCLSIDEQDKQVVDANVFPNPATEFVTIASSNAVEFKLYKLNGSILLSGDMNNELRLNITGFEAGIYIIEFTDEFGNQTRKKLQIR